MQFYFAIAHSLNILYSVENIQPLVHKCEKTQPGLSSIQQQRELFTFKSHFTSKSKVVFSPIFSLPETPANTAKQLL